MADRIARQLREAGIGIARAFALNGTANNPSTTGLGSIFPLTSLGAFPVRLKTPAMLPGESDVFSAAVDTIFVVNPAPTFTSLAPSSLLIHPLAQAPTGLQLKQMTCAHRSCWIR